MPRESAVLGGGSPSASHALDARPRSPFLRLLSYARPYLGYVLLALVFAGLFAGARSARFYLIKPLMDEVAVPVVASDALGSLDLPWTGGEEPPAGAEEPPAAEAAPEAAGDPAALERSVRENFWRVILAGILVALVLPVASFAKDYLVEYALGRIQIDVQRSLCAKLLVLPLRFHHGRSRGDVLSRTLNDVTYSQAGLRLLLDDVVQAGLSLVVGLGFLVVISWQLTLISLVVAPPVIGVIAVFGGRIRKSAQKRQEKLGDMTQRLVEILAGIKVIKAFRAEANEEAAFTADSRKLFKRHMKVVTNRVLSRSLVEGLNSGIAIGMMVLGAGLVLRGQWGLSIGDLAAFMGVMFTTYRHPKTLAKGWNQLMDAVPAAERFFELLDAPGEVSDAADARPLPPLRSGIRFEHVTFTYGREPVLQDLDLELHAGEVTAVVGRTGAGKTTLADLLLRLYDPDAGAITVDSVDLRHVQRASLLENMAVVTQQAFLFRGSIRDNILYGRPDASDEEVLAAARAAHVDGFVSQLPQGYDTDVGQEGVTLSGGQRQRVTIARALLRNPRILIFDEATSSLDVHSERSVQKAVDALLGGRTVLLIAHRLSTVRSAHRIAVIEDGHVAQLGSHEELMAQPGPYRELVAEDRSG